MRHHTQVAVAHVKRRLMPTRAGRALPAQSKRAAGADVRPRLKAVAARGAAGRKCDGEAKAG
jgi:hypothetical protein